MDAGARIKELRGEAGWPQETLARKALVSRQTVSNWQTRKTYPDIESLSILCDLFGVSIDSIVRGDLVRMGTEISREQIRRFNEDSAVFAALGIVVGAAVAALAGALG